MTCFLPSPNLQTINNPHDKRIFRLCEYHQSNGLNYHTFKVEWFFLKSIEIFRTLELQVLPLIWLSMAASAENSAFFGSPLWFDSFDAEIHWTVCFPSMIFGAFVPPIDTSRFTTYNNLLYLCKCSNPLAHTWYSKTCIHHHDSNSSDDTKCTGT